MTAICLIIIGILCLYLFIDFIDAVYEPLLDYTIDEELLLWYNTKNSRKYIKLW